MLQIKIDCNVTDYGGGLESGSLSGLSGTVFAEPDKPNLRENQYVT
ncbi:MAG: hypothetical protein OEZ03_07785 [Alphaproteobacteria bacterium]|jgi:hypothetical protein|nr:hypothetical protein [Alphaproteobacteria bacterium]